MIQKKRRLMGAMAAVLAFVMLFSVVYIAVRSNCDCTGKDCAVWHHITACEHLLKSFGMASAVTVIILP